MAFQCLKQLHIYKKNKINEWIIDGTMKQKQQSKRKIINGAGSGMNFMINK